MYDIYRILYYLKNKLNKMIVTYPGLKTLITICKASAGNHILWGTSREVLFIKSITLKGIMRQFTLVSLKKIVTSKLMKRKLYKHTKGLQIYYKMIVINCTKRGFWRLWRKRVIMVLWLLFIVIESFSQIKTHHVTNLGKRPFAFGLRLSTC